MKDFHFGRDSGASGKVLVVANPLAGRVSLDNGMGDSEHPLLSELCEMLNRGGTEVSIVEEATAEGMASAVELHVSRSVESKNAYDAVVVVGGDGTVSVVAGVLARIGAPSSPGSSAVVNTPPDYPTGAGAHPDYPTVAGTPTGSPTSPTSYLSYLSFLPYLPKFLYRLLHSTTAGHPRWNGKLFLQSCMGRYGVERCSVQTAQ